MHHSERRMKPTKRQTCPDDRTSIFVVRFVLLGSTKTEGIARLGWSRKGLEGALGPFEASAECGARPALKIARLRSASTLDCAHGCGAWVQHGR